MRFNQHRFTASIKHPPRPTSFSTRGEKRHNKAPAHAEGPRPRRRGPGGRDRGYGERADIGDGTSSAWAPTFKNQSLKWLVLIERRTRQCCAAYNGFESGVLNPLKLCR
ncbi:hypothetical protein EVAR_36033_1 [Eumeta japonica]|uniref:Uncharacterized protein n=1 Tax=Eumeta variegata TaxID=151549 RepID=A0A4C1WUF0_EUMVA|nr:hypothetical protein EVAR_36033_1 [Eumeta japonica]